MTMVTIMGNNYLITININSLRFSFLISLYSANVSMPLDVME